MSPEERRQIIDKIIIEYQKIANFINDASNQPTIFRTKDWVKINH